MDISKLKFFNEKPLLNTNLGSILLWMDQYTHDLTEDEFWEWLFQLYEKGPTPTQFEEVKAVIQKGSFGDAAKDPGFILWCTMDHIWQYNYDDWYDRGYRIEVTGGWYWRWVKEDRERRIKEMEENDENSDLP